MVVAVYRYESANRRLLRCMGIGPNVAHLLRWDELVSGGGRSMEEVVETGSRCVELLAVAGYFAAGSVFCSVRKVSSHVAPAEWCLGCAAPN